MFQQLTDSENNELYVRMARAGARYYRITGLLTATGHFDRYMDAWREIIGLQQDINDSYNPRAEPEPEPAKGPSRVNLATFDRMCRTCGFMHSQQDEACPRWAPEVARP